MFTKWIVLSLLTIWAMTGVFMVIVVDLARRIRDKRNGFKTPVEWYWYAWAAVIGLPLMLYALIPIRYIEPWHAFLRREKAKRADARLKKITAQLADPFEHFFDQRDI